MLKENKAPCFDIFTAHYTIQLIVFILFFGMTHHACLILEQNMLKKA